MSETYQKQADRAAKTVEKKGYPVTFFTPAVAGGTDPDTGDAIPDTPAIEKTGHGLVFSYKANEVDGTTVQRQDAYVLYVGDKPDNGMYFDDANGKKWQVQYSDALAPTVATILYKVQIR